MIIIKLIGGLGNQMFQYALGRHLAYKFNTALKLDITGLVDRRPRENFTLRNYEFEVYNIQAQIATKNEIAAFISDQTLFNMTIKIKKKVGLIKIKFETEQKFQPSVLTMGSNVYLAGYWQSEKYFNAIEIIIRNDLQPKEPLPSTSQKQLDLICNENSVSLHIRRGDYATNILAKQVLGTLSLDYYKKSTQFISQKVLNPYFFIFSDDLNWVKQNMNLNYPFEIIDGNPDYADLYLMSMCKHNIIANSSFSWLGAWLNPNLNKVVIAPKQWFANETMNAQTNDLIPGTWIRL